MLMTVFLAVAASLPGQPVLGELAPVEVPDIQVGAFGERRPLKEGLHFEERPTPVYVLSREQPTVRLELSLATQTAALSPADLAALSDVWGEGTTARTPERWREDLRQAGVLWSVRCDIQRCALVFTGPAEHLDMMIAAMAEVTFTPRFPAEARRRAGAAARRGWRDMWRAPGLVHGRAVTRLLWPARVEGPPAAYTSGALAAVHRRLLSLAPPNFFVVGPVERDAVTRALANVFAGGLSPFPEGREPAFVGFDTERHVLVDAPTALQARVTVAWAAPADPAWGLAFRVLALGAESRLTRRLREQDGLTYGVEAAWRTSGESTVALTVDPERLSAALLAIGEELSDVREHGVTEQERLRAVRQELAEARRRYATSTDAAGTMWTDAILGLQQGESVIHINMYQDVSLAQIAAAAREVLGRPRLWVVSGDTDVIEPALEEAGWAIDRRMDVCAAAYGGRCP